MRIIVLLAIILSFISLTKCSENERLHIKTDLDSCYFLRLDEHNASTFGIKVISNSLNDTALIDGRKVPPKMTGDLYRGGDYYADSIIVCYKKYKASKGELIISYYY
jgi:hypothetical protein